MNRVLLDNDRPDVAFRQAYDRYITAHPDRKLTKLYMHSMVLQHLKYADEGYVTGLVTYQLRVHAMFLEYEVEVDDLEPSQTTMGRMILRSVNRANILAAREAGRSWGKYPPPQLPHQVAVRNAFLNPKVRPTLDKRIARVVKEVLAEIKPEEKPDQEYWRGRSHADEKVLELEKKLLDLETAHQSLQGSADGWASECRELRKTVGTQKLQLKGAREALVMLSEALVLEGTNDQKVAVAAIELIDSA